MIALQINDTKNFMNKLLVGTVFDTCLLEEAHITTFNHFFIDGHMVKEFFTPEDLENKALDDFSSWKTMKPICFDLIKGKKTPVNFKVVLHLSPSDVTTITAIPECSVDASFVKALVLTVKFDGSSVICTTGTAFHSFQLDKSLDLLWDIRCKQFFDENSISYEVL